MGTILIGLLVGLVFAGSVVQPAGFACGRPVMEVWHQPGNPTRGAVAWYWGGTLRIITVYDAHGSTVYVDQSSDGRADIVERYGLGEGDVCDVVTW